MVSQCRFRGTYFFNTYMLEMKVKNFEGIEKLRYVMWVKSNHLFLNFFFHCHEARVVSDLKVKVSTNKPWSVDFKPRLLAVAVTQAILSLFKAEVLQIKQLQQKEVLKPGDGTDLMKFLFKVVLWEWYYVLVPSAKLCACVLGGMYNLAWLNFRAWISLSRRKWTHMNNVQR